MKIQIKKLIEKFDLKVGDGELFIEAFTHASYRNENSLKFDYQRLEFLGDAIIQMIVTEYLYKKNPENNEGELTKKRKEFVRGETLQKVSKHLELIHCCYFGKGVDKKRDVEKVNEDIFESFIGAIYLSEGWEKSQKILNLTLIKYCIENNIIEIDTDFKSLFQEAIQKKHTKGKRGKVNRIHYRELKSKEKFNFKVELKFDDIVYGIGSGNRKNEAEQNAAKNALSKLNNT